MDDILQRVPDQEPAKIGENQIRTAVDTLKKYKNGKTRLEERIISDEEFWKLRHWAQMRKEGIGDENAAEPTSGWLVNVVLNRHADAMDSYPEPNFLPRAEDDKEEANNLKKIVPVILKRTGFKRVWSGNWWNKLKSGTSVYGVFWDGTKSGGLGDIEIKKVDLLNLYWEPGVTDIQDSRNVFYTELEDNETLVEQYPQLEGKLKGTDNGWQSKYIHDDTIDTSGKSLVVNWYYKRWVSPTKRVLHYCKFVMGCTEVLYATENETEPPVRKDVVGVDEETGMLVMGDVPAGLSMAERGWYDHGKYPFVLDVLYPEEGMITGFGYVDICKSPQQQIDVLNQAILKNAVWTATPRYFVREDSSLNEEEFADIRKPFVHTDQNLAAESIRPIERPEMSGLALSVLQMKTNELRETSGNTESATGVSSAGVTAASAIAALQEASGKLSRDMIGDGGYNAYEDMVIMVIDLIRQFYDQPRMFRITGDMGREEFTAYSNAGLMPKPAGDGYRTPVFDIEVVPQTESRYNKTEYNSLALELYGAGFFDPNNATTALACLQMMDFKNREDMMQQLKKNGDLSQQLAQWQQTALTQAQVLDQLQGGNTADMLAEQIMGEQTRGMPVENSINTDAVPDGDMSQKNGVTEKARKQTQAAAKPQ